MSSNNDTPSRNSSNLVRTSEHFSDFPETFSSSGSRSNTNETSDVSEPLHQSLTQLGTDVTSSDSGLSFQSGDVVEDGVLSCDSESLAEQNSSRTESRELVIVPLRQLIARSLVANSPFTGDKSESNQESDKSDQPRYR